MPAFADELDPDRHPVRPEIPGERQARHMQYRERTIEDGRAGSGQSDRRLTRMVEQADWIFVVHDVNPRAVTKKVQGVVEAQSWYVDFSPVSVAP